MASLFKRPNGFFTLQFPFLGKRRTLRLKTKDQRFAEEMRFEIERIIEFKTNGLSLDVDSTKWIKSQPIETRKRIAGTGLIEKEDTVGSVGGLCNYFLDNFSEDISDASVAKYEETVDRINCFFGTNTRLTAVSIGDVEEYQRWLKSSGKKKGGPLADSSADNLLSRSKTIFKKAENKGWIDRSPFSEVKTSVCSNPDNFYFVSAEEFAAVDSKIKAGPGSAARIAECRLVFALGRWGGLRCPSEPKSLLWDWIDFDNDRFKVFSVKNKRFKAKQYREVPIFPELRPFLDEMRINATDKEYVCPILRTNNKNAFRKMIKSAIGPDCWPRLFQNLRATRSNEIERQFGPKIESAWIGHGQRVAETNYFAVSDADFDRATTKKESSLKELIDDPDRLQAEFDDLTADDQQKFFELIQNIRSPE